MKIVAIIPARYDSSRFPGKPLVDINGKSMIQRVYEQVSKLSILDDVIVATDDDRIMDHVRSFGASVHMTLKSHLSGTDRVAEVAKRLKKADVILNIQGDEPFIKPEQIEELYSLFSESKVEIGSLVSPLIDSGEIKDSNVVKASLDNDNFAIWFSRDSDALIANNNEATIYKHIGIYGFRRNTLLEIAKLQPGTHEQEQNLEQLRWMENGYKIKLGISNYSSISIDTPENLKEALERESNL